MKTIFYDVDTQNDFMNGAGALYVPGAESIKTNLAALTGYAKAQGIQIVASVDSHGASSPELKRNGGPFPDHAMRKTYGQMKIIETQADFAHVIPNRILQFEDISSGNILIEKDAYDVSTNPNFGDVIKATKASRAIVYGVATDYCVKAAGLALRRLGLETIVVTDAISAVDKNTQSQAFEEMTCAGVKYANVADVLEGRV